MAVGTQSIRLDTHQLATSSGVAPAIEVGLNATGDLVTNERVAPLRAMALAAAASLPSLATEDVRGLFVRSAKRHAWCDCRWWSSVILSELENIKSTFAVPSTDKTFEALQNLRHWECETPRWLRVGSPRALK